MDNTPNSNPNPNSNNLNAEFRVAELDNEMFTFYVAEVEKVVNDPLLSKKERKQLIKTHSAALNELFGNEYQQESVDTIGFAYIADSEGTLTGQEDIIVGNDLLFKNIKIIYVSSENLYKVVFKFIDAVDDGEGGYQTQTYYFQPHDVLKFMPYSEHSYDSEKLREELNRQSTRSETITHSTTFKSADSSGQYQMLENLARTISANPVLQTYKNEIVAIEATEYYIISPGEKEPRITFVDQSTEPKSNRTAAIGEFTDCSFIELVKNKSTEPLTELHRNHPSLCLVDSQSGVIFLVPFRAFQSIDVSE